MGVFQFSGFFQEIFISRFDTLLNFTEISPKIFQRPLTPLFRPPKNTLTIEDTRGRKANHPSPPPSNSSHLPLLVGVTLNPVNTTVPKSHGHHEGA